MRFTRAGLNDILRRLRLRPLRHHRRNSPPLINAPPPLKSPYNDEEFREIYEVCSPYTMTSPERVSALIQAVKHVIVNDVPGAIVECGVWRGGSAIAFLLALIKNGATDREVFLFDTFAGMTEPTEQDRRFDGVGATDLLRREPESYRCESSLEEVQGNLACCNYPDNLVSFVAGRVEDTIPVAAPDEIALLRLDTDWYESTLHELRHLYHRISPGGVLIIDDYGYWTGARRATEQFFSLVQPRPFLAAVDDTAVLGVVPGPIGRPAREPS